MPAEVMHNLGNEFAGGLDEAGFEIFVRLVGLVDGAGPRTSVGHRV